MKKIITFLFCTAIISSGFAQTDNQVRNDRNTNADYYANSNDRNSNDPQNDYRNERGYNNDAYYQREQEIQKVNYQNNYQVQQVLNDCNLNIWAKRDVLNNLESQRIQRINSIYLRYRNSIAYYNGNEGNNSYEHKHHHDDDDDGR